jgi:hypothetical protein
MCLPIVFYGDAAGRFQLSLGASLWGKLCDH